RVLSPVVYSHCLPRRALHSFPTRRSSDLCVTHTHVHDDLGQTGNLHGVGVFELFLQLPDDLFAVNLLETVRDGWWLFPSSDLLRSEEHTSELQSRFDLVCRLLLEKKNSLI